MEQSENVDVDVVDLELGEELLDLLNQLGDDTPPGDILPFELCVLRRLLVKLAVLEDKLGVRGHVLGLPLLTLHLLELISLILGHALLL